MTRIVGGLWGGRRLVTPAGDTTRPTSEKVRAALASSLTAAGGLEGARVLDLYAGSGALGLELVSRGASSAVFVERTAPRWPPCAPMWQPWRTPLPAPAAGPPDLPRRP